MAIFWFLVLLDRRTFFTNWLRKTVWKMDWEGVLIKLSVWLLVCWISEADVRMMYVFLSCLFLTVLLVSKGAWKAKWPVRRRLCLLLVYIHLPEPHLLKVQPSRHRLEPPCLPRMRRRVKQRRPPAAKPHRTKRWVMCITSRQQQPSPVAMAPTRPPSPTLSRRAVSTSSWYLCRWKSSTGEVFSSSSSFFFFFFFLLLSRSFYRKCANLESSLREEREK